MSIDNRVVNMQFNNAQFEQGIGTTMSSLEQLKQSLNFEGASKGFDNINKAAQGVDLSGVSAGIEAVKVSFSALQIVGITVLSELTKGALQMGKSILGALTDPIMVGGKKRAQNIEQAKFMFRGLGMDVEEAMSNAREAVLGTAYGLDEAAKVASQFGASGIKLGDEMTTALKAIAGTAAMTSSGFSEIGDIFTTVAGQGQLMTMQLRQLESRGLNAAAVLAKSMGTTEAAVRDMVTKGTIDFAMFSKAMSEAFGEHATKANEMFSGAMSNMRSALARIGANFWTPFFENAKQMVNAFTPVIDIINEGLTPAFTFATERMEAARVASINFLSNFKKLNFRIEDVKESFSDLALSESLMTTALKGVAGGAEVAGKTIEQMGLVYREIAKEGTLSSDWLNHFVLNGINLTAKLAEQLGKTEEEIHQMTAKGEISFEMFAAAMNSAVGSKSSIYSFGKRIQESFTSVLQALHRMADGITQFVKPIKEAFKEIFPSQGGEVFRGITNLVYAFSDLTWKLRASDETLDKIKRTFKGVFAILDIGFMAAKGVINMVSSALEIVTTTIKPALGGFLNFTAILGDFFVALRNGLKEMNAFAVITGHISTALNKVKDTIQNVVKVFKKIDLGPIGEFSSEAEKQFQPLTTVTNGIAGAFEGIAKVLEYVMPLISKAAGFVADVLGNMVKKIGTAFSGTEFSSIVSALNSLLLGGILFGINNFMDRMTATVSTLGGYGFRIKDILDKTRISLAAYQTNLKAKTLFSIAAAVALLAASLLVMSTIDSEKLGGSLAAVSLLMADLVIALNFLSASVKGALTLPIIVTGLIMFSAAVLILAAAMKKISSLEPKQLMVGLLGIITMSYVLVEAANRLSVASPRLVVASVGLIAFATAMRILTESVKELGTLKPAELAKGLIGVGILLGELVLFLKVAKLETVGVASAIGLIALATALKIMASAIADFGKLKVAELAKGLGAMIIILDVLVRFTRTVNSKGIFVASVAMIALGTSMLIFAKALAQMGAMKIKEIGKGLLAMAGALTAVTIATRFMPKNMMTIGVGLIAISAGLLIMSKALSTMGAMSGEQLKTSLIALSGGLLAITKAANAMRTALPGAAAMLVMATAIGILTPSLLSLSKLDLPSLGVALLALAGVFAVIGGSAFILAPLIPVILGLAAAVALLGVGIIGIGAGVALFATGIATLVVAGAAGTAAMIAYVTALINLIPSAFEKLGEGILALAKILGDAAPELMKSAGQLLDALIDTLLKYIPKMVDFAIELIMSLWKTIASKTESFTTIALEIIEKFLIGLSKGLPGVVSGAVDVVVAFMDSIAKEGPRIVDAGFKMMIDFLNGIADAIRDNTQELINAGMNVGDAIVDGVRDAVLAGPKRIVGAVKDLGKSIIDGLRGPDALDSHSPSKATKKVGEEAIEGLLIALSSTKPQETAALVAQSMVDEMKYTVGEFKDVGRTAGSEFLMGMTEKEIEAKAVAEMVALATAHGIEYNIEDFEKAGKKAGQAYIDGLNNTAIEKSSYIVSGLIDGLQAGNPVGAARDLGKQIQNGLLGQTGAFTGIGETQATEYLKGLTDKEIEAKAIAQMVAAATQAGIEFNIKDFEAAGMAAGQAWIDGLNAQARKAEEAANNFGRVSSGGGSAWKSDVSNRKSGAAMSDSILQTLTDEQAKTYWAAGGGIAGTNAVNNASEFGKNVGNAFASGVTSANETVKKALTGQAYLAKRAAEKALGIKSPSTVFMEIGKFTGLGFINGLKSMASNVSEVSRKFGVSSVDSVKNAISKISEFVNADIDFNPSIRPVLDLAEIQNGMDKMTQLFAKENELATKIATEIDPSYRRTSRTQDARLRENSETGNVYFTQYNSSPKSLNRTEIYRQTNNLLSNKGRVVPV